MKMNGLKHFKTTWYSISLRSSAMILSDSCRQPWWTTFAMRLIRQRTQIACRTFTRCCWALWRWLQSLRNHPLLCQRYSPYQKMTWGYWTLNIIPHSKTFCHSRYTHLARTVCLHSSTINGFRLISTAECPICSSKAKRHRHASSGATHSNSCFYTGPYLLRLKNYCWSISVGA